MCPPAVRRLPDPRVVADADTGAMSRSIFPARSTADALGRTGEASNSPVSVRRWRGSSPATRASTWVSASVTAWDAEGSAPVGQDVARRGGPAGRGNPRVCAEGRCKELQPPPPVVYPHSSQTVGRGPSSVPSPDPRLEGHAAATSHSARRRPRWSAANHETSLSSCCSPAIVVVAPATAPTRTAGKGAAPAAAGDDKANPSRTGTRS